jgi:type I restriction enzyme, S subunit
VTWVKVGDICHLVNGKAFKPSDWGSSGEPIIRIQNLNGAERPFNFWAGTLERQVKVQTGDVLLAWSGTPGTSFGVHIWNRGSGILNQHIFRVDLDQTRITRRWFMYAVNGQLNKLIALAHGGVGLQHVTRPMVDSLEIPLPPLDEQRRIAAILDKADSLRRKRKRAIDLFHSLTQSIFLEMFASEAGASGKAEIRTLGDVCELIRDGVHKTPNYVEAGVPFVTVKKGRHNRCPLRRSKWALFQHLRQRCTFEAQTEPRRSAVSVRANQDGSCAEADSRELKRNSHTAFAFERLC